jgi:hypothetical protein
MNHRYRNDYQPDTPPGVPAAPSAGQSVIDQIHVVARLQVPGIMTCQAPFFIGEQNRRNIVEDYDRSGSFL